MNDSAVIKVLVDLGLAKEQPLTPEQERMFQLAVDPEERYLQSIADLFADNNTETKQ